jgi:AGZA family xanthine/uracil permease-like MFS transporter
MDFTFKIFAQPLVALVPMAIIFVAYFSHQRLPLGLPGGMVAIAVGTVLGWALGLMNGKSVNLNIALALPQFTGGSLWEALTQPGFLSYFSVILPMGIFNVVGSLQNIESAEAAGDSYPTTRVLTADGVVSLIGCLMGNPFINAVYIGHPGWKAMGGRIGYSAATGVMVVLLSWFGIISVLLALVPVVAISPILLYIGMLIGAQAFQTTPVKHAPAVVLALTPHLAAWAKLQIDTMLGSTINAAQKVGGLAADKVADVKAAAQAGTHKGGRGDILGQQRDSFLNNALEPLLKAAKDVERLEAVPWNARIHCFEAAISSTVYQRYWTILWMELSSIRS